MNKSLRDSGCISRWGGEEFAILLPQCDKKDATALDATALDATALDATALIEKCQQQLQQQKLTKNKLSITFSCGLVMCQYEETLEQTMKRADQLLYDAKAGGRNRVISV